MTIHNPQNKMEKKKNLIVNAQVDERLCSYEKSDGRLHNLVSAFFVHSHHN